MNLSINKLSRKTPVLDNKYLGFHFTIFAHPQTTAVAPVAAITVSHPPEGKLAPASLSVAKVVLYPIARSQQLTVEPLYFQ